jgi:hypothetical protein
MLCNKQTGYKDPIRAGYIAMPSKPYTGYAVLRSNVRSGSVDDVVKAVAYGKRIKFYLLSQAANPPSQRSSMRSTWSTTTPFPTTCACSSRSNRVVQSEPSLTRDKAKIDTLKSIGIEKGKPFMPDASTQSLLGEAAKEAHAWLEAKYETFFSPPLRGDPLGVAGFARSDRRHVHRLRESQQLSN